MQDIRALFERPDGHSSTSPPPSPSKRSCPDPGAGPAAGPNSDNAGLGGGEAPGASPAGSASGASDSGPGSKLAPPPLAGCERAHGNHWYLHFESEEHAQLAYRYLREVVRSFRDRPILVRSPVQLTFLIHLIYIYEYVFNITQKGDCLLYFTRMYTLDCEELLVCSWQRIFRMYNEYTRTLHE